MSRANRYSRKIRTNSFQLEYVTMPPLTIKEAVEISFKALAKPELHVNEIADHIHSNLADFQSYELEILRRSVSNFLSRDVSKKGSSIYDKVKNPKTNANKKGMYKIKKKRTPKPALPKSTGTNTPTLPLDFGSDKPTLKTSYSGKAGEFATISELLFRGYNASIMSVDEGVDIIASKNDKFFFIQVKTTTFSNNVINVPIKVSRFVTDTNSAMFYVIVVRVNDKGTNVNRFIILSQADIDRLKFNGKIAISNNGTFNIKIKQQVGVLVIYNNNSHEDITYHLDNFEIIK